MPPSDLVPLIALLVAGPLLAHADGKQDAQAHIALAMEAHDKNDFERAAQELQAAYAIDPNPDLLYAIGQVYVKLERCPEAIGYYQRYLDTKPPAQATVDTRQAIEICEKQAPVQEPAPTPPSTPQPVAPAVQARPWYKDPVGGALVATGVVSGVVGLVLYRGALSKLDAAESAPSLAEYEDLVDGARARRTYSVLLIGGGVVLIGAGVARYVLRDSGEGQPSRVGVVPTDRGGLVTWGGSF